MTLKKLICPTPYNRKLNVLSASLNKKKYLFFPKRSAAESSLKWNNRLNRNRVKCGTFSAVVVVGDAALPRQVAGPVQGVGGDVAEPPSLHRGEAAPGRDGTVLRRVR